MKEVITEIDIDATAERVWNVLAANELWHTWNPFIVRSAGALTVGQKVTNTMQMRGGKQMTFKPTILKAEPGKELRWLGQLFLPKLFDGEHYFQIESRGSKTHFIQGERFSGILIGMLNLDDVRASFKALNEALKKRAEEMPA